MRGDQNDRPYVNRILQMIPSKLLREHLKKYPPELTLLQWASIGGIVMRLNTLAKIYREMLPFAETDYERELLDSAEQDIDRVGFVDAQAQAVYDKQHDPNVVPYYPFLERCNLPILLKKGDIAMVRRGARKDAYLVWETPERLPACSDLTDESYYCYRLDGGEQEDLFTLHEHVHVCFADACAEDELSESQMIALRFLQRKLNSEQSVYADQLAAQCERARGYQGRNARAILQDMDQIMIYDNSKKDANGFYLVARRAYGHGCIAIPVKPGNALAEFVSLLNEETAGTDIQIIGISRPAAYGEYAPYTILDSVSSFRDAVSAMKTAITVEKLTYKGYVGTVRYSMEDALLYGSILDIRDSLNYHGRNLCELEKSFHDCVNSYLDFCVSSGKETDSRC